MTLETTNAYFDQSDVVQAAKEKERGNRTLPSRVDSFAGHLSDATSDISAMKKALWTLSQMIEIIDAKIDAITPTPTGDSQDSCASQKSVSALMGAMRVATATIDASAAAATASLLVSATATAAAAAAATPASSPVPSPEVRADAGDDDDDDGGARASPMAS